MNGSKPITAADIHQMLGDGEIEGVDFVFLSEIPGSTASLDAAMIQGQSWGIIKPPSGEDHIVIENDYDRAYAAFMSRPIPQGGAWHGDVQIILRAHSTGNLGNFEVSGPAANSMVSAVSMAEMLTAKAPEWAIKQKARLKAMKAQLDSRHAAMLAGGK